MPFLEASSLLSRNICPPTLSLYGYDIYAVHLQETYLTIFNNIVIIDIDYVSIEYLGPGHFLKFLVGRLIRVVKNHV